MQVATLKDEIETIGNQMASLTFDQPSGEVNNNSMSGHHQLLFSWNELENVIFNEEENCVDHQDTSTLLLNPQTPSQEKQPPILNAWKDDGASYNDLSSNPSILESVFQQLGKTGYLLRNSCPAADHHASFN